MYRRSLVVMAKRTVVRDPRKRQTPPSNLAPISQVDDNGNAVTPSQPSFPLPIVPQHQHQQQNVPSSTGATLGFYLVAGVGVSLGFALVGAVLG